MIELLRKHPLLCVAQVLAFLIGLPAFFSTVSLSVALTPEEAIAKFDIPLPSGWSAGVMNHGRRYLREGGNRANQPLSYDAGL